MPIANQIATQGANTAYLAKGQEVFDKPEDGPWRSFVEEMPTDGQYLVLDQIGPAGRVRELVGSRAYASLRAYSKMVRVATYAQDAIRLARKLVDLDKSGGVTRRLANYLDTSKGIWGRVSVETLLSNPKGIDNVSLLNDSHPHSSTGSTWDNKTTAALDQAELKAGILAMEGLLLENGSPAGVSPTHLMVGPKLRRTALDLCGAMRPVAVNSSGAPDATSSVVAAVMQENWLRGQLQVIVEPLFSDGTHDDDWFLMDLSKPGVRPIAFGEATKPYAVAVTSPDSPAMIENDEYEYFVQGDAAWGGFIPHCIYGRCA